jgi:hypothetical protein
MDYRSGEWKGQVDGIWGNRSVWIYVRRRLYQTNNLIVGMGALERKTSHTGIQWWNKAISVVNSICGPLGLSHRSNLAAARRTNIASDKQVRILKSNISSRFMA